MTAAETVDIALVSMRDGYVQVSAASSYETFQHAAMETSFVTVRVLVGVGRTLVWTPVFDLPEFGYGVLGL